MPASTRVRTPTKDLPAALAAIHAAVSGNREAMLLHRLHCVALVASGQTCADVSGWLGVELRTVQRWVQRFELEGSAALVDRPRAGRPSALPPDAFGEMARAMQLSKEDGAWSVDTVMTEASRRYGVTMSRRHAQRVLAAVRRAAAAVVENAS